MFAFQLDGRYHFFRDFHRHDDPFINGSHLKFSFSPSPFFSFLFFSVKIINISRRDTVSVPEPNLRQCGPVPTRAPAAWIRFPRALRHTVAPGGAAGCAARNFTGPVPRAGIGAHVARGALSQG